MPEIREFFGESESKNTLKIHIGDDASPKINKRFRAAALLAEGDLQ